MVASNPPGSNQAAPLGNRLIRMVHSSRGHIRIYFENREDREAGQTLVTKCLEGRDESQGMIQ